MSRIRSIHPGIATDEAYMAMSLAAKAAWPVLWTECDDDGVFEWKPLALKAKIFPADNIDFSTVLDEFEHVQCVTSFEHDGRKYGLVRNFVKFQRPKKPTSRGIVPHQFRTFVGLKEDGTRPIRNKHGQYLHHDGTEGEGASQKEREDGVGEGGKKNKQKKIEDAADAASPKYFFESGVIRLTEKDFNKWKRAYPNLNLEAELLALTEWAGQQKSWFFAIPGALTKRDRELALRLRSPPEDRQRVDPRL